MAYPLSNESVTSVSDILSYSDTVNWIIGASRTGKTTFLARFIETLPQERDIYLFDTSGKYVDNELAQIESVKVLPRDSQLNEECLEKLPSNSFVIVDDFQLVTKKAQWEKVTNYCAHHFHLSIFLVVHSHQNTEGLHYALKNARNLYLTYSNNSRYFLNSLARGKYLNFFNKHWKEGIEKKHICFINTHHCVIVSFIDKLLYKKISLPVEIGDMAENGDENILGDIEEKRWVIINKNENVTSKSLTMPTSEKDDLSGHFHRELSTTYSKSQFPRMFKITRCLLKRGVLDLDERVLGRVSLMVFLAFTQRFAPKQNESEDESDDSTILVRSFGFCGGTSEISDNKMKKSKKDLRKWKKICQKLVSHGVTIPITLLKNPVAKKIFQN